MGDSVVVLVLFASCLSLGFSTLANVALEKNIVRNPDLCNPLVIAHRGASGYVPEHTLGAYALAITMGADYVEPDVVMTRDGHLIARHENELSLSTDVAEHTEFANRYRVQSVDGRRLTGWFSEDFTLAEIKTLRAKELYPTIRPGNTRMDRSLEIPTFQEIIDLVKSLEVSQRRIIGIYPEIKHGFHFQSLGLPMEQPLVDSFHKNGYRTRQDPAYIQSFEVSNLKELRNLTDLRLIQLYGSKARQPFDQAQTGTSLTYGDMSTAEGLKEVAAYADAVGPEKSYIIPRDADSKLGTPTSFVEDAHAVGLKVHPYTFRAENNFLPLEFRSVDPSPAAIGDASGEMQAFFDAGIDGLFTDQPDIPVRMRGSC